MLSLVNFLAFTSICVCICFHNAEGCCCEVKNERASNCNYYGCNCKNLRNGYCLSCKRSYSIFHGGKEHKECIGRKIDYDDYCPDKRRKRELVEVKQTYYKMDSNQDGNILFEEFLAFENITKMDDGNTDFDWAKRQWALMDKNQDGYVTPKEMQTYLE